MKRPAFQFYPADWRNDAGLKLCSLSARGLWIEMICIMHAAEPYGHLCAAGRPLDARDLSKLVGESERDVKKWFEELVRNNVCSSEEGAIVSRRMVRDESLRERRAAGGEAGSEYGHLGAEHGKKGGRPRKDTGDKKPPFNPPPSSSSSSSSSSSNTEDSAGKPAEPSGFAEFWQTWPSNTRKGAKGKCLEIWKKSHAERDAAQVLAHVQSLKNSASWQKNGGEFIPAPLVYLNKRSWEGAEMAEASSGSSVGHFV